jgi:hypothetical protein
MTQGTDTLWIDLEKQGLEAVLVWLEAWNSRMQRRLGFPAITIVLYNVASPPQVEAVRKVVVAGGYLFPRPEGFDGLSVPEQRSTLTRAVPLEMEDLCADDPAALVA